MTTNAFSDDEAADGPIENLIIRIGAAVLLLIALVLGLHDTWPRHPIWHELPEWVSKSLGFPFAHWGSITTFCGISLFIAVAMIWTSQRREGAGLHYDTNVGVFSAVGLVYSASHLI